MASRTGALFSHFSCLMNVMPTFSVAGAHVFSSYSPAATCQVWSNLGQCRRITKTLQKNPAWACASIAAMPAKWNPTAARPSIFAPSPNPTPLSRNTRVCRSSSVLGIVHLNRLGSAESAGSAPSVRRAAHAVPARGTPMGSATIQRRKSPASIMATVSQPTSAIPLTGCNSTAF